MARKRIVFILVFNLLNVTIENWIAGTPNVTDDKAVEVLYLFSPPDDDNQRKVVGAVSNRTYNYYTQGTDSVCLSVAVGSELEANPIYQNAVGFNYNDLEDNITFDHMGFNKEYKIDWINAMTGDYIITTLENTSIFQTTWS